MMHPDRKEKRTIKFVLNRDGLYFYQHAVTIKYNDPISTYNNVGTTDNEKRGVQQK
jgi:hypothetical protein